LPRRLNSSVALRRAFAILIVLAGVELAYGYPLGSFSGIAAFAACVVGVFLARGWWVAALPVALVAGDLYPWTGSLLVNEADLFLLAVVAALLWRADYVTSFLPKNKNFWFLWLPLAISVVFSFYRGWQRQIPALPGDELSLYTNNWNSVRVVKGFMWGLVLAPLLVTEFERNSNGLRKLVIGMQMSAFFVGAAVIWERAHAVGLFDVQQLYRATGPFFSMHTGGQHIDAYWAFALPFLFVPTAWPPPRLFLVVRLTLIGVSYYAIAATMSRAMIVWAAIATLVVVTVMMIWNTSRRERGYVFALLSTVVLVAGAGTLFKGNAIHERFADSGGDLKIRWNQWNALCRATMVDLPTITMGTGLGTIPYIASIAYGLPQRPAELVQLADGETALRLRPGKAVYVEQLVNGSAPGPWRLEGQLRQKGGADLQAHVCQKMLFDSFQCNEHKFAADRNLNTFTPFVWSIDVGWLTDENRQWQRVPVTLAFSASGNEGFVDVSNLRLTDARGASLLNNEDFRFGSSRWFFTSDDHAAWRAENIWIQLFLEQGLLGVSSVAWLIFGTLGMLVSSKDFLRNPTRCVLAVAILGFLAIGLFGSLLDTPWITIMLCVLLAASQSMQASGDGRPSTGQFGQAIPWS
jgi:hypothetical protein